MYGKFNLIASLKLFYIKNIKGTLIQIWKSPCIFLFIWKYYPENFVFLILRILELCTRKFCVIFVYKNTETIEYHGTKNEELENKREIFKSALVYL